MATKTHRTSSRIEAPKRFCIVATNAAYEKLCRESLKRLPVRLRDRFAFESLTSKRDAKASTAEMLSTLIISRLADLPLEQSDELQKARRDARHLLFLENLPVEAMPARLMHLNIRSVRRLHLATERTPQLITDLIYRLFSGMVHADVSDDSIVDAWVENGELVLLLPNFERRVVPLNKLSRFIGSDPTKIDQFEIDEDGRFLFWPHADAHFGLEHLTQLVDPTAALAAKQRSDEFNKQYGAAIRTVREESELKQVDIAGITERHLRRIERGEQAATKSSLEVLAKAHGLVLDAYLKKLAGCMRTTSTVST
jgi:hypothetical protein